METLKEAPPAGPGYPPGARQLIATAERLFGELGLEGVSLRQVVAAAGQANNSAVQHHFGAKEGFIRAIIEVRLASLEASRARYLAAADRAGTPDVRALLQALWLPILEEIDERGEPAFAKFIARLWYEQRDHLDFLEDLETPAEVRRGLFRRLHALLPHLSAGMFAQRMLVAQTVFLFTTTDRLIAAGPGRRADRAADAIEMVAAVLAAPVAPPVAGA